MWVREPRSCWEEVVISMERGAVTMDRLKVDMDMIVGDVAAELMDTYSSDVSKTIRVVCRQAR